MSAMGFLHTGEEDGRVSIAYFEGDRIFKLDTLHTSYLIGIVD